MIARFTATGFGDSAQEFGDCFIETLDSNNERREQAISGLFQAGKGEPVSPNNALPLINLYDACMPTQVMISIVESLLSSQPELTAALGTQCLTELIEGPERRTFFTAFLMPASPDDRRIVNQAVTGCVDLGRFVGAAWERDFGTSLASTTIDCLSETGERFDMYLALSDTSVFESWQTESLSCYTESEANRIREQRLDDENP